MADDASTRLSALRDTDVTSIPISSSTLSSLSDTKAILLSAAPAIAGDDHGIMKAATVKTRQSFRQAKAAPLEYRTRRADERHRCCDATSEQARTIRSPCDSM